MSRAPIRTLKNVTHTHTKHYYSQSGLSSFSNTTKSTQYQILLPNRLQCYFLYSHPSQSSSMKDKHCKYQSGIKDKCKRWTQSPEWSTGCEEPIAGAPNDNDHAEIGTRKGGKTTQPVQTASFPTLCISLASLEPHQSEFSSTQNQQCHLITTAISSRVHSLPDPHTLSFKQNTLQSFSVAVSSTFSVGFSESLDANGAVSPAAAASLTERSPS